MRVTRRTALRFGASAFALPAVARGQPPGPAKADLALLQAAMAKGRFVTYQPSGLKVINGKITPASADSIRADLKVLRPHFDSLITYGAQGGAEHIPDLATEQGFRAVVMGVWDFYNEAERFNLLAAARRNPKIVAGLSLGNEMVLSRRAAWGDLEHMLDEIHAQLPGMPLTLTEAFAEFVDKPDAKPALARMDFLLANVHPIFEPWFRSAGPPNWSDFVVKVSDLLAHAFTGPILIKETGIPTGPSSAGYTPAMQHDFYRALEKRFPQTAARAFSYFSAFDAPWRRSDVVVGGGIHPEEAFWGLYDAARAPKAVMADFPALPR